MAIRWLNVFALRARKLPILKRQMFVKTHRNLFKGKNTDQFCVKRILDLLYCNYGELNWFIELRLAKLYSDQAIRLSFSATVPGYGSQRKFTEILQNIFNMGLRCWFYNVLGNTVLECGSDHRNLEDTSSSPTEKCFTLLVGSF